VLISNAGHGRKEIRAALREVIDHGLLASYVFVHERRARLAEMLRALSPDPQKYRVFLLSTGSEATENCIKLSKTYARAKHGPQKKYFVTFHYAFHGRTMGAQLAGGIERQKEWMVDRDRTFVQVPFPDGYKNEDTSFGLFLKTLAEESVLPQDIAGVMTETYQGGGPDFLPVEYAQKLEAFCREHDIVMCYDEVQAGFGRTGKMFGYEHYGVRPDLIACGKGISSSLPISAVIGREDIMGLYGPGSMTSTHSGSPLPVAAAIANLEIILKENLAERAARLGEILMPELRRIREKHPEVLGCLQGKGLVAGIQVVKPGTKTPDPDMALRINIACFQKGLLMFAPVGARGECLKIAPPLTITEDALRESLQVFEEAVDEVLGV
jgi:4-aminobutyrate aminotransferase-like enzyme